MILIGHSNRLEASNLYGGSWVPSLSLQNLKTRLLGQVTRSTDASNASTIIKLDLTSAQVIKIISLVNHNLSLSSSYRIRAGSTSAVMDYDSGEVVTWPAVYPVGVLDWENPAFWSGTYTPEEIAGYTTNACYILPVQQVFQYWQIEIYDSTNAAGYVQVGRVFIGGGWQPTRNAEVGLQLGWETSTQVQKALSGSKYYQRRTPYRVTTFSLSVMDIDDALSNAFEIDKKMGLDGEVMYVQDTDDTIHALRRRFLGTFRQMNAIEFPYSNLGKKQYVIEEIL